MGLGLGVWMGFDYKTSNRMSIWNHRAYYVGKYRLSSSYGSRLLYLAVL